MPPIKKYRTIFHYNNHFFLPVKLYSNFNFYDFELKINNKNSCKSIDGSLTKIHFHDQLNISLQFFDIFKERKCEKLSKKIRNIRKYIKLTWRDRGWNNFPPFFVASLLHGIAEIRKKFIAIHEMEGDETARDTILHLPVLFYPRTLRKS